jgi:DNA-binding transcriptional regulator YdaS (Cro superfamily)
MGSGRGVDDRAAGSQVAKRLRLSPTDLKQQGLARPTAIPATAVVPYPGVVEVTAPALEPAAPSPTLLEVERPEGAGWRLQYRDSAPLAAVLRAFLEPA